MRKIASVNCARVEGAMTVKAWSPVEIEAAMGTAKNKMRTAPIVIETDPMNPANRGGIWWDVAVPMFRCGRKRLPHRNVMRSTLSNSALRNERS